MTVYAMMMMMMMIVIVFFLCVFVRVFLRGVRRDASSFLVVAGSSEGEVRERERERERERMENADSFLARLY